MFVHLDTGSQHSPPQRAHEPRRLDGRALGEEHAAAEDGRPDPRPELLGVERHGLLRNAHRRGSRNRVVVELPRSPDVRAEFSPDGRRIVLAGRTRLEVLTCVPCLPLTTLEERAQALLPAP